MSERVRIAQRRAFDAISETCPAVDRAAEKEADAKAEEMLGILREFAQKVADALKSHGTEPLRAALIETFAELGEREDELKESEARVADLEREVESLKDEVASLNRELANV